MSPTPAPRWLTHTHYAVLGLGVSGVAATRLLARLGKHVVASDTRPPEALAAELAALAPLVEAGRVELVPGRNAIGPATVAVASPGLRPGLPIFRELAAQQIPVISEVELAFAASTTPWVAITGTDGKTTTTELTGAIFRATGTPTVVAGNIGTPLCDVVEALAPDGVVVAEVSAFQLWTTHDFHPRVAAFTNIAADHLDHYDGNMEAYVASKRDLLKNLTGAEDWAVFNYDDPTLRAWAQQFPGRRVGYGTDPSALDDCDIALWSNGRSLYGRLDGEHLGPWLPELAALPLRGPHNALNMMCAAGIALSQGVSLDTIRATLHAFTPLSHRIEPCGHLDGVAFVDDSKATNVHAALAGLRSIDGPVVPIVGGVDKGLDLASLVAHLHHHARAVVLIGQIRERLAHELRTAGFPGTRIVLCATMDDAVARALELARPDATVILSPACSSFDMFDSYAHRGQAFQAAARALGAV